MIPTFIIDWPALILIGLIFGYGVKGSPSGGVLRTRAYISGLVVMTLFVALVYYSYVLAPDWMWMYFVRGSDVPDWMVIYALVLYYFAYSVGFFLKFELGKVKRSYPIVMIMIMLVASVAIPLALRDRYLMVGTMEEFYDGLGVSLSESAVGKVPGTLSAILIPLSLALLFWSRRQRHL